jgi:hypothetical protein
VIAQKLADLWLRSDRVGDRVLVSREVLKALLEEVSGTEGWAGQYPWETGAQYEHRLDNTLHTGDANMPIMAKAGGNFVPHPEGQFSATCIDVHDLGLIETSWQGVPKLAHKIDLYYWSGEYRDGSDTPLTVRMRFTLSLAASSALRPFLEAWRGREFTADELEGFDLETLIGAPALLQVTHRESNGKLFANITSIMRLPKGMKAPGVPKGYVRMGDRTPHADTGLPASPQSEADEDDDIPF